MKLRTTGSTYHKPGTIIEVDAHAANALIKKGYAEQADENTEAPEQPEEKQKPKNNKKK